MAVTSRTPFNDDKSSGGSQTSTSTSGAPKPSNLTLYDIKTMYYGFFNGPAEASPASTTIDLSHSLKVASIFTTEVVMGALGGFTGLHSIWESYGGGLWGYIGPAFFSLADASVNYALMFPAYKAAAGLKSGEKKLDETQETIKQLNNLDKILTYLLHNKNVTVEEKDYAKLEAICSQLEKKIAHAEEFSLKKIFSLVGRIVLFSGLFISVIIMRVGGGYLFLDSFFQNLLGKKSHLSLQWDAPGISMGVSIALYIVSAILTRKNAILDLVYPLRPGKFKAAREQLNQLKNDRNLSKSVTYTYKEEEDSTFNSLKLSDEIQKLGQHYSFSQPHADSDKSYIIYLTLGIVIFSEILFGILLNDYVGMYSALFGLKDKLSFWHPLYSYIISGLTSSIDTVAQAILMFPVLKATVSQELETATEHEKKMDKERLIYLSQIMREVIKQENDANGRVLLSIDEWKKLRNTYDEFYKRKHDDYIKQVSFVKTLLEYTLLAFFVGLRATSSFFLITHFIYAIGVTVTGGWCLIPGICMALYTYNGYVTRRSSIGSLFHPAEAQEFAKLNENFKKIQVMRDFKDELDNKKTLGAEVKDDVEKALNDKTLAAKVNKDIDKVEKALLKLYSQAENLEAKAKVLEDKAEILEYKNLVFQVGSELIFSATRSNNYLDTVLFFKRRQRWKESIGRVRKQALAGLKDAPKGYLAALKNAKEHDMFKQHRNWWAFPWMMNTAAVRKINEEISQLESPPRAALA